VSVTTSECECVVWQALDQHVWFRILQIIGRVFAIKVPLLRVSVRTILTIVASLYGYWNRKKIKQIILEKKRSMTEVKEFVIKLDDADGLEKLKVLSELAKKTKESKQQQTREQSEL